MAYIGKIPATGAFQKCDALSASATADYTLQVGSTNVVPESVNHMIVSLNGVIQQPTTSFTVSGSTLSFSSSLTSNDSIDFVMLLGNVLDIGTPSDATVTNAKLASDLISGETDIGGAIADADLFLLDDGAGGTLRKTAASRIATYIGDNTPAILVYRNLIQNISDNTETKVLLDTEVIDTDGTFASNKWTPAVAGTYWIHGSISYGLASNGDQADAFLYKNGSSPAGIATFNSHVFSSDTMSDYTATVSGIFVLDADDYIELYARGDASGQLSINPTGSGAIRTWMMGYKLIT